MDTADVRALRLLLSGPVNELLVHLSGPDAEMWGSEFEKFAQKKPCWSSDGDVEKILGRSIDTLDISVRASTCLNRARIFTIRDLVSKTGSELRSIRNFGPTSFREIHRKLGEIGLTLGVIPTVK